MAFIFITKGKTNWKYLLIVFILGVIVGVGSLWLSSKQKISPVEFPEIKKQEKENETANWKIYKNEECGYEIKYPKDWTFRDFATGAAFRPLNKPAEFIIISANPGADDYKALSFDEYVKIAASQEIEGYKSLNSIESIITEGKIKGYKTTWWKTKNFLGSETDLENSLPITYFPPSTKCDTFYRTIQVDLDNNLYEDVYEIMIKTFAWVG